MQKRATRKGQRGGNPRFFDNKSSLNFRRRRRHIDKEKVRRVIMLISEMLIVVIAAFGIVRAFGLGISMAGESMEPTITSGERVLQNRVIYYLRDPKPNDVVVYTPSENLNAIQSIKRVIGVPGDHIEIRGGKLYVNDTLFADRFEADDITDGGLAADGITLGEDEYFLLGDNRNNSEDSRYVTVGNIGRNEIESKVWWKADLSDFGFIN